MKPLFILLFAALTFHLPVSAQVPGGTLKKVLELKIPREGGSNAAHVAWHPVLKRYYAAMAGNPDFFIGVYDLKGTRLSTVEQKALFDVRGLWYNPGSKTLQMNGYSDFGWAEYKLTAKGMPASVKTLFDGMTQPGQQSVGAFDPKAKIVYFLKEEGELDFYDHKTGKYKESLTLHLGISKEEADEEDVDNNFYVFEDYNSSTVVFTGIKGAELGLLNHLNKEVELYNAATGYLSRKLKLPEDAPVTDFLNFAYANGIYWIFDKDARIWIGFR